MAAAMGVIVKKMLFQEKCSNSHPPTIGPRAMATPVVAPHSPMALARSPRSVKVLEIRDSVAGKIIAAPKPMTPRATINCSALVVNPPAALAKPNTTRPATSIPFRPSRSLRFPETRSRAANTRL